MYYDEPTQPVQYLPPQDTVVKKGRRRFGCLGRVFVGSLLLVMLVVFTGVVITGTLIYANLSREIEAGITALDAARDRETFETTQIVDRNGNLLWEIFGEGKRTNVPLDSIPVELRNATVAVEDDTFYENIGLDAPSLIAAILANLRNPDERPVGGSTITQQLVKHIAFDYDERTEVSYNRKTKEIILAWMMNRKYSKDEILEMYLNEIYYGNLAYGIEAAAQTYFGKHAAELTLAETSLLAGLPQSPVELDPLTNLEAARERQWLVLNLMYQEGYITREQAEQAYLEPLTFKEQEVSLVAPHFAVYVRQLLEEQFGADVVANGGLRVTTSINLEYQRLAEELSRQHVAALSAEHNLNNAAIVVLKPGTGEILAMLGSVDYHNEVIDGRVNVTLSPQQPGSSIKPITYAAALSPLAETGQAGWTAADILWDVPVTYPQFSGEPYRPVNYDGRFHGPLRLRDALANSYNIPAVLLLQDVGIPRFLDLAQRMGLSSLSQDASAYGLSLTLGGGDVTPLELTGAYSVFANGGYRIAPVAVLKVENSAGEVLFEYQPAPEPVLDPRVAYLISDILDDDAARVPAMGTNNPLALPFPAAVKTGTTNDFRDNWTVGYTPGLVVGVWTGNTDNSEMINVSGLTGAAPLWSAYMQAVYSDYDLMAALTTNGAQPPTEFVAPAGLEERTICTLASVTVGAVECNRGDSEWFLVQTTTEVATPMPVEPVVTWERLEPAVWRMPAIALPPLPAEVQVVDTSNDPNSIPAQLFCHFSQGTPMVQLPAEALASLFLTPPRNSESLPGAHRWAIEHNLPILPTATCTEEMLALAGNGLVPAVWRITSPAAGDAVNGIIPIEGIASFDPSQVQFYKIELGMGDLTNPQWVTLGDTHNTPVVNGTLEMLHADGLPAGEYLLRLIVVMQDGNYVGEPHTIAIRIGS
jgi:1A family penicillin-binding protein